MVLKCKKIRNVEKEVCTAEQKIAYNYAFQWYDIGRKILKTDIAEVGKFSAFADIENNVIKSIKEHKLDGNYNIDAIIIAFRNGFRNYCENYFIATDYKQIGEMFAIPYEVK